MSKSTQAQPAAAAAAAPGTEKKTVFGIVPIPNSFYAIKADLKLIAGRKIVTTLTVVLYLLSLGVFGGLWAFYSDKSQWTSLTVIQSEWQKDGYKCTPLQKYDLTHSDTPLSTGWAYDDCVKHVQAASAANVFEVSGSGGTYWDYNWTAGGKVSYDELSRTDPVSQATWELEGYQCRPSALDGIFGISMSYEECLSVIQRPSADTCSYGIVEGRADPEMAYWCRPFANSQVRFQLYDADGNTYIPRVLGWRSNFPSDDCGGGGLGMFVGGTIQAFRPTTCWSNESPFTEHDLWIQYLLDFYAAAVPNMIQLQCNYWKQSSLGPFTCTKTPTGARPTSKQEAITYYQIHYGADAICAPLKENAPFQCTRSTPKSPLEILSLSIANTQLAYGVIGSAFVFLLYKTKKAKKVKGVDETSILARLEELEQDRKRLDQLEASNKQLEASNKQLEASNKQLETSVADLKSR